MSSRTEYTQLKHIRNAVLLPVLYGSSAWYPHCRLCDRQIVPGREPPTNLVALMFSQNYQITQWHASVRQLPVSHAGKFGESQTRITSVHNCVRDDDPCTSMAKLFLRLGSKWDSSVIVPKDLCKHADSAVDSVNMRRLRLGEFRNLNDGAHDGVHL